MSATENEKAAEALETFAKLQEAGHPQEYIWAYVNSRHYCSKSDTWSASFAEGYTHFMADHRQQMLDNPPGELKDFTEEQEPEEVAATSEIFAKLTGRKLAERYAAAYADASAGGHSEAYCRAYGQAKAQSESEEFAKGAGSQAEKEALRHAATPAMAA